MPAEVKITEAQLVALRDRFIELQEHFINLQQCMARLMARVDALEPKRAERAQ